jgi:hypothetical protein
MSIAAVLADGDRDGMKCVGEFALVVVVAMLCLSATDKDSPTYCLLIPTYTFRDAPSHPPPSTPATSHPSPIHRAVEVESIEAMTIPPTAMTMTMCSTSSYL